MFDLFQITLNLYIALIYQNSIYLVVKLSMRNTITNNTLKNDQTIIDNFKIRSTKFDKLINNDGKSTGRSKYGGSIAPTPKQAALRMKQQAQNLKKKIQNKGYDDKQIKLEDIIQMKYLNNNDFPNGFIINGMNFFQNQINVNQEAEVLADCYSVKGDYFYLKKGQIIMIRSRIQEYAEIKYQKFVGFFPANLFRLLVKRNK